MRQNARLLAEEKLLSVDPFFFKIHTKFATLTLSQDENNFHSYKSLKIIQRHKLPIASIQQALNKVLFKNTLYLQDIQTSF